MDNNYLTPQFFEKLENKKYLKEKISNFIDIIYINRDIDMLIDCIEFIIRHFNLPYKLIKNEV